MTSSLNCPTNACTLTAKSAVRGSLCFLLSVMLGIRQEHATDLMGTASEAAMEAERAEVSTNQARRGELEAALAELQSHQDKVEAARQQKLACGEATRRSLLAASGSSLAEILSRPLMDMKLQTCMNWVG